MEGLVWMGLNGIGLRL